MNIRPSAIAGTWYPDDPGLLTGQIDQFLAQADVSPPAGRIWGVMAPHAGYRYSGPVAAYAFKCLAHCQPELVVVVSPMHHARRFGLLTSGHEAYATPLGLVEVDQAAIESLSRLLERQLGYGPVPLLHDPEYSLEIELPFLQRVLPEPFRLLPIMILDQRTVVVKALGEALADLLQGREVLLVASSDLSHFYAQPAARQLDLAFLRRVAAFDPAAVMSAEEEGVGYACGRGAVAAVLWAARGLGADRVDVLRYATSGDVTGDMQRVVGYGAAVIWQRSR